MKKIVTTFLVLSVLAFANVSAQSLQTSNLYLSNPFSLNAAYAGKTEGVEASLQGWNKWNGLSGDAPVGGLLTVHSQLDGKMGLGGRVLSDRRGAFSSFIVDAAASYTAGISEGRALRLALNAGLIQSRITDAALANEFVNLNDPLLNSFQETNLQVGASALLVWDAFELGVTIPNLLDQGNQLYNRPIILTAIYKTQLSDNVAFSPVAAFQNMKNHPSLLDVGGRFTWQEELWGQVMYRSNKAVLIGGGVNLGNVKIGYMYEAATGELSNATNGTHEVFLGVRFGKAASPSTSQPNSKREATAKAEEVTKPSISEEEYRKLNVPEKEFFATEEGNGYVLNSFNYTATSTNVPIEGKYELSQIAAFLKKYPDVVLEIGGHTSTQGDGDFNQLLSQRRADAIVNYLAEELKVPSSQLQAKGYGEDSPMESNDTQRGRALNERIEVKIIGESR